MFPLALGASTRSFIRLSAPAAFVGAVVSLLVALVAHAEPKPAESPLGHCQ